MGELVVNANTVEARKLSEDVILNIGPEPGAGTR
jgi:hypothetical protein